MRDGRHRPQNYLRPIIPNFIGTIIVIATFQIADVIILLGAFCSIGLGVPVSATDRESMLSNPVDYATLGYLWQIYPVAFVFTAVVVAFNFVRDAFEVRLQRR